MVLIWEESFMSEIMQPCEALIRFKALAAVVVVVVVGPEQWPGDGKTLDWRSLSVSLTISFIYLSCSILVLVSFEVPMQARIMNMVREWTVWVKIDIKVVGHLPFVDWPPFISMPMNPLPWKPLLRNRSALVAELRQTTTGKRFCL